MNQFLTENLQFLLKNKKILLGITGSIAAFKTCDLIRYLKDCGADVRVILSAGARNFVTETTLETLSGNPVLGEFWSEHQKNAGFGTHHIDTARWADLILIAPATAHFLAKMANGFADDLLTTELLAFQGPTVVAPAMNPAMYSHPAVQSNVQILKNRGIHFAGPVAGLTSCGEDGLGRMSEPEEIILQLSKCFYGRPKNRSVLITLGPTRSPLDPVRFLTNRSSGIMGASLAWAAIQKGYQVIAVVGPCNAQLPQETKMIRVQTAAEMLEASLENWNESNIFISSAAVLDWEFMNSSQNKLKKELGLPQIELKNSPDILFEVSRVKQNHQFILGFAAETENLISNAEKKLIKKNCDAIFANNVSSNSGGFESHQNAGYWIQKNCEPIALPRCNKTELARTLIALIEKAQFHE